MASQVLQISGVRSRLDQVTLLQGRALLGALRTVRGLVFCCGVITKSRPLCLRRPRLECQGKCACRRRDIWAMWRRPTGGGGGPAAGSGEPGAGTPVSGSGAIVLCYTCWSCRDTAAASLFSVHEQSSCLIKSHRGLSGLAVDLATVASAVYPESQTTDKSVTFRSCAVGEWPGHVQENREGLQSPSAALGAGAVMAARAFP